MSAQIVLLPVFVLVGLTLALLLIGARRGSPAGDQTRDMALSQSELPLLFYVLIALALPLRHADLVIVLLSWVFVVTCFAQVGVFAASIDARGRSMASLAGVLVLFAMWIYFALRILLLISVERRDMAYPPRMLAVSTRGFFVASRNLCAARRLCW